jgi:hypothetical protein
MKGKMAHDPENCHPVSEYPNEKQQVIINTNAHPNGEINIGFYSNGKWFRADNSEISEENILCWHLDNNS